MMPFRTACQQLQNFALPRDKQFVGVLYVLLLQLAHVIFNQDAADRWTEKGFALGDRMDGRNEVAFGPSLSAGKPALPL